MKLTSNQLYQSWEERNALWKQLTLFVSWESVVAIFFILFASTSSTTGQAIFGQQEMHFFIARKNYI
jgi:hypothetical protein